MIDPAGNAMGEQAMDVTIGGILHGTWRAMTARFWTMLGMYFAWLGISLGLLLVLMLTVGGSMMSPQLAAGALEPSGEGLTAGIIIGFAATYLVYILVVCAQYAALSAQASPLRDDDFGAAFARGVRSAPTLLAVIIVFLLGYFAFAAVLGSVAGAFGGTGFEVVAALLVLAAIVYLGARLGIVLAVVPVEGIYNPFRAIGRAWSLTGGRAWPIIAAFLIFVASAAIILLAISLPFIDSIIAMDEAGAPPALGGMMVFFVGVMVFSVIFTLAYAALLATVHAQLASGTDPNEALD